MSKLSFIFLWILVFIMPWEDIFLIPGLTSTAKILGMFACLVGLAGALFSGRVKLPWALLCVALFSGWCAISADWATSPVMSLQRAQTYVLLLTFVWLICQLADNPRRLKSLMRACVLGTAVMVANMYLGYLHAGVPLGTEDEVRYSAEGANANGVACFSCLGILFAFYLITRREKSDWELPNWFYWGVIVAAGLAVPLTGSRAGVLSAGVTAFVLLGRVRKLTWKARLGLVVAVGLLAVLIPQLVASSTFSRIAEGTASHTFGMRYEAWLSGWKAWTETPILGVGAGCYRDVTERLGPNPMVAHNTVVSVLVESGLVGFTIYFLYWAIIIRQIMLLPKADRFFWLGVLAAYLPSLLSSSAEYQKLWWFLGALVLCQEVKYKVVGASRQISTLRPKDVGLALTPPRPSPHPS